jgi:hypothetical protein
MRIYLQPPHLGSVDLSVQKAQILLRNFDIATKHFGGSINELGVLLVEARDIAKALAALNDAGMRAVMN